MTKQKSEFDIALMWAIKKGWMDLGVLSKRERRIFIEGLRKRFEREWGRRMLDV